MLQKESQPTPPKATGLGLIEQEPDDLDKLIGAYQRDESTPPKVTGLGFIEKENDLDELEAAFKYLQPLFDDDEEPEMQDRSHPPPSLEKLVVKEEGQEKILEPKDIPQILAFIEKVTETKVAALDVEVSVPKIAASFGHSMEFRDFDGPG